MYVWVRVSTRIKSPVWVIRGNRLGSLLSGRSTAAAALSGPQLHAGRIRAPELLPGMGLSKWPRGYAWREICVFRDGRNESGLRATLLIQARSMYVWVRVSTRIK